MAYLQSVSNEVYPDGGGHTTIIASPANLKISPPERLIALTNSSMYRLMANAVISHPSWPSLWRVSVKLVNPDISANITTDLLTHSLYLNVYLSGRTTTLVYFSDKY